MSQNTVSTVGGSVPPTSVRKSNPKAFGSTGWIWPGAIVIVSALVASALMWIAPIAFVLSPIGVIVAIIVAVKAQNAAKDADQNVWPVWISFVVGFFSAGPIIFVLYVVIFAGGVATGAISTAPVGSPTTTVSQPAATVPAVPVDLVAQYADNYPATQAERFAIADSLPGDFLVKRGSVSDSGLLAETYVWERWSAAYLKHDPRYLWGIVDDPATSPLYQQLKSLPESLRLNKAFGDANLESQVSADEVRDIGVITFDYQDGHTDTAADWVFRLTDGHWRAAIGNAGQ